MSYIAPDTTVVVCKGVPLDNSYANTLYWNTADLVSQQDYFASMAKYTYDALSYQRVGKNTIRVEQCADDLYDCNYMYFKNSAFGNKEFYAFITGVEYINNITSEITYEIDVMQTWHFSYEVGYCFVEREHSDSDEIGDNIVPEEIETGDYVTDNYNELSLDTASGGTRSPTEGFFIAVYADSGTIPETGSLIGNVPSGLAYIGYSGDSSGCAGLMGLIRSAVASGDIDKVVSAYVAPKCLCSAELSSASTLLTSSDYVNHSTLVHTGDTLTGDEKFGSYTPRNKKLYTYPYNYFGVDNGCGGELKLRYEFFVNNTPKLNFFGTFLQPASISCCPTNYAISSESDVVCPLYDKSITITQFPQCSYCGDLYTQWVAQNSVPMAITGATSAVTGAAFGGLVGEATSALSSISQVVASGYQASVKADLVRGQLYNGVGAFNSGVQAFYGGRYHVTEQQARIIDNFFTMFGYQTNRVKQPNRNSREKWNYVKTRGCIILAQSMPADDTAKIEEIYDKGITFWHSPSYVGHYNLTNPIV